MMSCTNCAEFSRQAAQAEAETVKLAVACKKLHEWLPGRVSILETKLSELEADLETSKDRERKMRQLLVRLHPKANAFWQGEIATLLRELEAEKPARTEIRRIVSDWLRSTRGHVEGPVRAAAETLIAAFPWASESNTVATGEE